MVTLTELDVSQTADRRKMLSVIAASNSLFDIVNSNVAKANLRPDLLPIGVRRVLISAADSALETTTRLVEASQIAGFVHSKSVLDPKTAGNMLSDHQEGDAIVVSTRNAVGRINTVVWI